MTRRAHIGTSGWNYRGWANGVFYPPGLNSKRWLQFYAQSFDSVEVNNSFYRLPEKRVFESWRDSTPPSFVFAVKASRFVTHMKKLLDPAEHVGLLLNRAAGLGPKLGVILFQLPPFWRFHCERLAEFCHFLSTQEIIPGVRVALEVRHPSWLGDTCFDLLRQNNVALAFADWPAAKIQEPVTADFVFVRRHGPEALYASAYSDSMLQDDAERIGSWLREGRDVFAYFNNDAFGHAVRNALSLKQRVESQSKKPPLHRGGNVLNREHSVSKAPLPQD